MESCQSQECKLCKCTWRKEGESPCNSCTECTPRITMPCAPHSRCAQCVLVLAAQQEVEPPPRKPDIDEEIGYRLVQEAPAIREGVWDPATLSMAQGADPACQEVFTWFGGDLSPTRPPTLRPEETSGELKWFNSRFEKLRLVHYKDGTILLAILSETEQGEKPSKNENLEAVKIIVPVSQRTAVITMAHSKAHWGVTKTVGAIVDHFTWEKMREDVKKFVLQCAICLEKQGVNLKEGAHMPRVSHEQGEIVYLDLIGPVSEKISSFKYLLTMMDGFSRFVMVAPLRSKSAKEVSSAVLNTWVKGAGGIPKTFHADNGKEFTAHIAQQLYNKLGIHFSFGWAENHQSNPVERFHQTLYKLINSLRAEGENNFIEGVKTAVMLYNGAKHLSTGVTPNILFLGREVVLPTDLIQGAPPLGPDNGTPNEIVDQMLRQAQQYQQVATEN
jgi:hypothetical protein